MPFYGVSHMLVQDLLVLHLQPSFLHFSLVSKQWWPQSFKDLHILQPKSRHRKARMSDMVDITATEAGLSV